MRKKGQKTPTKKNKIVGEGIEASNAKWTFSEKVPEKFSKHVKRSVPLYEEGHELVLKLSDFFIQENSICYELGVSTGALIKKLAKRHKKTKFIGIDIEKKMIKQAQKEIEDFDSSISNIELLVEDINTFQYEKSDFIVSYYTIQFIPPRLRQDIIDLIYKNLNWGGAFIMFEKVRAPDARFQDIFNSLYTDYKLDQGYSSSQIIAKARSLKGVLEPFSTQGNIDLLSRSGFEDITSIFKHICFEGFLCIK